MDTKGRRLLFSEEWRSPPISLEELLSCPTDYIEDRQVKGIYYERKSGAFFLFIRRRIYSIPDLGDLIAQHFAKKLIEPYLESPTYLGQYDKLDLLTTWVKNLKYSSFFVPTTDENNVWEITPELLRSKGGFKAPHSINHLARCPGQILHVKSAVFCFDEQLYYKLVELESMTSEGAVRSDGRVDKLEIADIFCDTALSPYYTGEQRLKFIFNYDLNKFVLMTATYSFVFEYAKFSCKSFNGVECARIVTNFDPDERGADLYANHLFDNHFAEAKNLPDLPNDQSRSTRNPSYRFSRLILLVFLLLFLIVLLLCNLMIIRNRKLIGALQKMSSKFLRSESFARQLTGAAYVLSKTTSFGVKGRTGVRKKGENLKSFRRKPKRTALKGEVSFPVKGKINVKTKRQRAFE